jgi:Zn-dependent peptidase ImmA (M78 family)
MPQRYTKQQVDQMVELYQGGQGATAQQIADQYEVPLRSVIAKLSSLGVYKRKQYLNKQGLPPKSKQQQIEEIALLLGCDSLRLESLEKVNKPVLDLIIKHLK